MRRDTWYPLLAHAQYDHPQATQLLARQHGVWLVERAVPAEWTDGDREAWLAAGMPEPDSWKRAPGVLHVRHVGGAKPENFGDTVTGSITVRPAVSERWHVYPTSRWPKCSCCGEPVPCRAELEDREVTASLDRITELERVLAGCCWACQEPITRRQEAVTYDGPNLLLPGREPPLFHTRRRCRGYAKDYEIRWIAEDARRERILTWPKCPGILVVHGDGSSECESGPTPLGGSCEGQPGCQGHLTHDHGTVKACYVGGAWLSHPRDMPGCPRGCVREGHPGARPAGRPRRRDPAALAP